MARLRELCRYTQPIDDTAAVKLAIILRQPAADTAETLAEQHFRPSAINSSGKYLLTCVRCWARLVTVEDTG
jgi:hypothetical protein